MSSLCGVKGLEMDVPDDWKKTPLHYAAQRGASICWIYLNKRGVNKETVDIYGNTPLGVALPCSHHNAAIIMIQKHANVRPLSIRRTQLGSPENGNVRKVSPLKTGKWQWLKAKTRILSNKRPRV